MDPARYRVVKEIFLGSARDEIIAAHLYEEPVSPTAFAPNLPKRLESVAATAAGRPLVCGECLEGIPEPLREAACRGTPET